MPRDVNVRTNKVRFDQVARLLVEEVEANKFPFDIMWLPQHATPPELKKDPLVLSRAIFFANLFMRGQVQSNYIYRQAMKICLASPEVIDPVFMSQEHVDERYVFDRIAPFIEYRLFEMPGIVLQAFRRLQEDWAGDPRKLVEGIDDPDHPSGTSSVRLHRRMVNIDQIPKKHRHPEQMRGFVGVREKIANLFAYFMRALELMSHEEKTEVAFDFHACRTFTATGGLILEGSDPVRFEDVTRIGSKLAEEFCLGNNIPSNKLSDGFWWHSKAMCAKAPGNRTLGRSKRKDHNKDKRHSLDYKPQTRQKIELKMYVPDWSKPRDVRQYERSCGKCILEQYCTINVSSGFYGEEGTFKTQPRTKPIPHLFGERGLPHHAAPKKEEPPEEVVEETPLPLLPGHWPEHKKPEVQPDER